MFGRCAVWLRQCIHLARKRGVLSRRSAAGSGSLIARRGQVHAPCEAETGNGHKRGSTQQAHRYGVLGYKSARRKRLAHRNASRGRRDVNRQIRRIQVVGVMIRTDAKTAPFALSEHKEHTNMKPKNTICLWFDKDAQEAARFYAATFPDSKVTAVHEAPGDYPSGKKGDVLTVEFTVLGLPCLGLNGGPAFKHTEAFSFQIATDNQEETDRYWNAIVANGGTESACGWCKDKWGLSWQITPRVLLEATRESDTAAAKRAFQAMMTMRKIDIAAIEAARRGAARS